MRIDVKVKFPNDEFHTSIDITTEELEKIKKEADLPEKYYVGIISGTSKDCDIHKMIEIEVYWNDDNGYQHIYCDNTISKLHSETET